MWPSFGAGSPRTGGTRAKSVIWKETVTSRPSTSLGVGNVISTYRISIRGVPVAGPWVTVTEIDAVTAGTNDDPFVDTGRNSMTWPPGGRLSGTVWAGLAGGG